MNLANTREKTRTLIVWEVPAVPSPAFIEMYMNPQQIQIQEKKLITPVRTKGGYILQYWGEELTRVSLSGNTGDGSIEALNVLKDIYRSEQIAVVSFLNSGGADTKRRQSLAQLATSVVMWYQGQGMRGFFEDFQYTESVDQMGILAYTATFVVVETIGRRKNFLPWQRRPWSTLDKPATPDGRGSTTPGGYGSRFKIGEMNSPAIAETGTLSDPKFNSMTNTTAPQGILQENLADNNLPLLTPANLFANT